jgi:hypothetical protein
MQRFLLYLLPLCTDCHRHGLACTIARLCARHQDRTQACIALQLLVQRSVCLALMAPTDRQSALFVLSGCSSKQICRLGDVARIRSRFLRLALCAAQMLMVDVYSSNSPTISTYGASSAPLRARLLPSDTLT